jgi:hypothetical protein
MADAGISDHASLFVMSTFFVDVVDEHGAPVGTGPSPMHRLAPLFQLPTRDEAQTSLWRASVTSIYKTKDNRFYHIHGVYTNRHIRSGNHADIFQEA